MVPNDNTYLRGIAAAWCYGGGGDGGGSCITISVSKH